MVAAGDTSGSRHRFRGGEGVGMRALVVDDSSAMRAERFDERTAENVAPASTNVPPAVANEAMVAQSAMGAIPIQ